MINIDKKDTFRACQYYKTNANVKQYVKNEYNEAKRITDKVGRKFIDIPAVILGMQVIHGGGGYEWGAELVMESALWSSEKDWNDKPVVINHTNGSATDIENLDEEKIGFIYASNIVETENDGKRDIRLHCRLRLDIELLKLHDDADYIISEFDKGNIMEMSTGYFLTDWYYQEGTFRGRDFVAMQANIKPNHLALLPHAMGAFGLKDGGGANRNNKIGEPMKDNEKTAIVDEVVNQMGEKLNDFVKVSDFEEKINKLNESIASINDSVKPIIDKSNSEAEAMEAERKNLIEKVKENSTLSESVLAETPNEVLRAMIGNEVTVIGHKEEDEIPVLNMCGTNEKGDE